MQPAVSTRVLSPSRRGPGAALRLRAMRAAFVAIWAVLCPSGVVTAQTTSPAPGAGVGGQTAPAQSVGEGGANAQGGSGAGGW